MENPIQTLSRVELRIRCRRIPEKLLGSIRPCVEVFEKNGAGEEWKSLGKTEHLSESKAPDFSKKFDLEYNFSELKFLRFKLWNVRDKTGSLSNAEFLGQTECTLGEIVGSSKEQFIKTFFKPGSREGMGLLLLNVEETEGSKEAVFLKLSADINKKGGLFRKLKPFLKILRSSEDSNPVLVHRTEHCVGKKALWEAIELSMGELCKNDPYCPLFFECWDHHRGGNHELIGCVQTNLANMISGTGKRYEIKNGKHNLGALIVEDARKLKSYTFLDYIAGGCQINLITAIDFTKSNGLCNRPDSLHYLDPHNYNSYERAIRSVGEILLEYDSDKLVPLYGFGAKLRGKIKHCFPLNLNEEDPNVLGLDQTIAVYREALQNTVLSGPTIYSKFLQKVISEIESVPISQENQEYFILLVLTDGDFEDEQDTIDWIVRGSHLPLSIIFVGLGNDGFEKLIKLDGDEEPLVDSSGRMWARDIVQFVPFREVSHSSSALARCVLEELPREIPKFFQMNDIDPNPPVEVDISSDESSTLDPRDRRRTVHMTASAITNHFEGTPPPRDVIRHTLYQCNEEDSDEEEKTPDKNKKARPQRLLHPRKE